MPRITVITLGVDDLDRSERFYRDGLGLKTEGIIGTEYEQGAVAFFELEGGLKLALWPRKSLAQDTTLPSGPPSATEFTLGHTALQEHVAAVTQKSSSGGFLVDVWQSTRTMERLEADWRAGQSARVPEAAPRWSGAGEPTPPVMAVSHAPQDAIASLSGADRPDVLYQRLIESRRRHRDDLNRYKDVARRVQTRLEEDDILYSVLGSFAASPEALLVYPLIRWNVRSVLWDEEDPDAGDDPIRRFCRMRLQAAG